MPLARRVLLTALAAGSAGAAVACDPASADGAPAAGSAATAARRLLPRHWRQLTFRTAGGRDTFQVSGRTGRVTVTGGTPATQLTGLNWYLRNIADADINWAGRQLRLPAHCRASPAQ
ncbi:hypothetical protein SAV31267_075980 [Streptomyces avermitilis]|uniref:Alpha-N-acetylglucosaminidase N-terminal domain-containing protein n=1 Tax=Streptomyces avermitilis TaxID=33903 RepID=A0A4D4N194_STRAX|nr:hypothetical protein SAV31267_075980 [Streptomyces avermitilis]